MSKTKAKVESTRCHILLSNTARQALTEHIADEHAFFKLQQYFYVHIEKVSVDEQQHITFYFDDVKNAKLQQHFPNRVVIIDCVFDERQGLIAKSFRTRGKGTPVATNRRAALNIHFIASRISGHTYTPIFTETIQALPVAQERFDYVNKRISSWEGYLKVLDKNAAIEDIQAKFQQASLNGNVTHVTLQLSGVEAKAWKQLKGLAARVRGQRLDLGEVTRVDRTQQTVEIELKADSAKLLRRGELILQAGDVEFSNAATKAQLKRLLKGFERLKEGLAANPQLETILFEDKPTIAPLAPELPLAFHNDLNAFQREAVTGAMRAQDLYVIQGPPGTGKTTVISEICYQNAKAGLKTLVASQSNLAVDNALSRLLSNQDIRILRYGRTESIEEEGKKFIEENVAAYWKDVTYRTVRDEIAQYESKEHTLKAEQQRLQLAVAELKLENVKLEQQIEKKQQAASRLQQLTMDITELKKQLVAERKLREEKEALLAQLTTAQQQYSERCDELQGQLQAFEDEQTLERQIDVQFELYKALTEEIEAAQLVEQQQQLQQRIDDIDKELAELQQKEFELQSLEQTIDRIKKVHDVEMFMERYQLRRSYVMDRLLTSMERLQPQLEQYKGLKDVAARLEKALHYSEATLNIYVEPEPLPITHTYTIAEVADFLTQLSHAFAQRKVNAQNGRRSVTDLHLRRAYIAEQQAKYDELIREVLLIFEKFKLEIKKQLQQREGVDAQSLARLQATKEQLQAELRAKVTQQQEKGIASPRTVTELQTMRNDASDTRTILQQQIAARRTCAASLAEQQQQLTQLTEQVEAGQALVAELQASWKEKNSRGVSLEKEKLELEQLVAQNPEQALAHNVEMMRAYEETIQKLSAQIALIPITEELQKTWLSMLETANEHDLDEIRKLYVKHANVIGTTCVASANKEFMENYPTFDVVIIDEVSKATPPELLLPMLKGAKIILVGDHHQLPPLIGDETFDETLQQVIQDSPTFEEKRELEKLLEESLFERLYNNLPAQNKTMLAIQYRMHANIMEAIAPFYANEQDHLRCGLTDSDTQRAHGITTSFMTPAHHLMWMDVPNEAAYFEQRVKDGVSLYNEAELRIIAQMLTELNEAVALQKDNGQFPLHAQKSVGVISFYAEQVKRIVHLVDHTLQLPHLHIRTGSVDKFQGMEMDLIFVSMVRNHDQKKGDIGFAKDYRRLNVALSRARELLVLIGSTHMFTQRPKQQAARDMYARLLQTVKQQQGYRMMAGENV